MWTDETRLRHDRSCLRYTHGLTDEEWAELGPLIPPAKPGGNKPTVDIREVLNRIMCLLGTGCQWRDIPKDLPPRSNVHDYLDRWDHDGTLDRIQGCSPLSTDAPLQKGIKALQSRGVSVLTEVTSTPSRS